jgi:DNA segregation ATPase FtsK/SpoIIIE, S-DNA-T family
MREMLALALLAIAGWALLSIISTDAGRSPNLGGPLGDAFAETLIAALGYQALLAVTLIGFLGWRLWRAPMDARLIGEVLGGVSVTVALSVATGFLHLPGIQPGGEAGARIASILNSYISIAGGYTVVMVALVGGLALMLRRAPGDLLGGIAGMIRPSSRESADGLGSDEKPADPVILVHAGAPEPLMLTEPPPAESLPPNGRLPAQARISRKPADSATAPSRRDAAEYKLPPLSLLDAIPVEHARIDEAALQQSAKLLEQKLADFGVEGRVIEVQPGPVVTMYKLEPGSGIKVSQIVNLADDLSMALRAATVRIQAPVPGEAVVGIEVPNRKREMIYLREIIEASEFSAAHSHLTIALGKDIAGHPAAADLAKMPHLLIAGATGTGKSVSIHTMIASILFNATADDVRFILIDPKMLELSVYEGIPHLLVPVVVDPEKAAAALLWSTQEMERRYRLMRDLGVRNIDGYNRAVGEGGQLVELRRGAALDNGGEDDEWIDTPVKYSKLPKIVIIIDELADLLLSEGKTVERDITRLAQKARAAGIHLILATQRPSVDVLTGLIKANLPARISLQVTSRVDSRTILDSIGAERLLGAGDMLFMPPGTAKLRRLHGPFVSETEIRKVCDFLRAQGAPDYQMEILETAAPGESESEGGFERDELYDEAVRIVLETNQASISMIQRRLRIGYNRAARMVEQMEHEGLVMPADGARPREVRMRPPN